MIDAPQKSKERSWNIMKNGGDQEIGLFCMGSSAREGKMAQSSRESTLESELSINTQIILNYISAKDSLPHSKLKAMNSDGASISCLYHSHPLFVGHYYEK